MSEQVEERAPELGAGLGERPRETGEVPPSPRLCPSRVLSALMVAGWAALFWFVWLSGRSLLYLSDRTAWLIPVGALILGAVALGRAFSLRSPRPRPISMRDSLAFAVMAIPVVIVIALPPTALGSFAADRRSALTVGPSAEEIATGPITLIEIAGAQRSNETMAALVSRAGEEVSFVGFVTRGPGAPADEFVLTRFLVSCCVADAQSVQVRVVSAPPGRFEEDEWVRARGKIYPLGKQVILVASDVESVPRPERPYITI
jgi:uncharacterized repeat protein (TIGR03943 family)